MNRKVRALMFSDLDKYHKGEQLMSYSNIMSSTGEVIIGNSEDFTIVNTFTPFKSKLNAVVESRAKGRRAATVTFEAVTVVLKNNVTGKLREVSIPTQKGKQEVKTQLAEFWKKDPQMGFKFSSIIKTKN